MQLKFVNLVPKYFNFAMFSKDLLSYIFITILACSLLLDQLPYYYLIELLCFYYDIYIFMAYFIVRILKIQQSVSNSEHFRL
jgi:hypothetical protein